MVIQNNFFKIFFFYCNFFFSKKTFYYNFIYLNAKRRKLSVFKQLPNFRLHLMKIMLRPFKKTTINWYIKFRRRRFHTLFSYNRPQLFIKNNRKRFLSLFFFKGRHKTLSNFVRLAKNANKFNLYWFFTNSIGFLINLSDSYSSYNNSNQKHNVIFINNSPYHTLWDQLVFGDVFQYTFQYRSLISIKKTNRQLFFHKNRFFFNFFIKYLVFRHRSRKQNFKSFFPNNIFKYIQLKNFNLFDPRDNIGLVSNNFFIKKKDHLNFSTFSTYNWKIDV